MTNAALRHSGRTAPTPASVDPLSSMLAPVADALGWDSERNWITHSKGEWTFMYLKGKFMDLFDTGTVIAFMLFAYMLVQQAIGGSLQYAVYAIIYLLMLLLYYLFSMAERLDIGLGKLFMDAAMDYGDQSKLMRYAKTGASTAALFIGLSVVAGGFTGSSFGAVIPILSVTGMMAILVNALAIPFAEELSIRGVLTPYTAEEFGVLPAILVSGVFTAALHSQIFSNEIGLLTLSGIYGSINAYTILKERALAPAIISHILVNSSALALMMM